MRTVRTYMSYKERGAEQRAESIKEDIQKDIDATSSISLEANTKHIVSKYSFITKWCSKGTADGQLTNPNGIAVDSSGYVYVADHDNHSITKYRLKGLDE